MNVRDGAVSVRDKYGRQIAVPANLTHIHSCGHYDGCYLFASVALNEPCAKCKRAALRAEVRADKEWLADYDATNRQAAK